MPALLEAQIEAAISQVFLRPERADSRKGLGRDEEGVPFGRAEAAFAEGAQGTGLGTQSSASCGAGWRWRGPSWPGWN